MKGLTKEKANWTTVYLGKPCKQEPCSDLSEAIKDVSEMINSLDNTGRVSIYIHNGGRKKLENILRCLEENNNHHDTTR